MISIRRRPTLLTEFVIFLTMQHATGAVAGLEGESETPFVFEEPPSCGSTYFSASISQLSLAALNGISITTAYIAFSLTGWCAT